MVQRTLPHLELVTLLGGKLGVKLMTSVGKGWGRALGIGLDVWGGGGGVPLSEFLPHMGH